MLIKRNYMLNYAVRTDWLLFGFILLYRAETL